MKIKPEETEFVDRATAFTSRVGSESVLLLVGSRSADLDDSWSDLDMWVIGDKSALSTPEREQYEKDGELFVDRGDYEAHWSFYGRDDLQRMLLEWPDAKMWLVLTSEVLAGCPATAERLVRQCQEYPKDIVEFKLKKSFGLYWSLLGPLNVAVRSMPETAIVVAGKVIEQLCRICCLAELSPFPYTKWLVRVAQQTGLGREVYPYINRAVLGIQDFVSPPKHKPYRELAPLKELRGTKDIVRGGLRKLGWDCSWLDETSEAVAEVLRHDMF